MKNLILLLVISGCFYMISCKKDSQSENFKLLTTPVWSSDSLLVNGTDASDPGGLLENFKGDVKFNTDYTGTFGDYTGTWRFALNETLPLTTQIVELTTASLKIKTSFPVIQGTPLNIRMTFKAK
jgi:hypothetical protein